MIPTLLALAALTAPASPQDGPEIVRVGHWLVVRGDLSSDGVFRASRISLEPPGRYEILIGTIPEGQRDPSRFILLGQQVHTSPKTSWKGVDPKSIGGMRVKVEGRYRGPRNLSARQVSSRGEGRERIAGRVDDLRRTEAGVEATIMRFTVLLPSDVAVEHELPLAEIPLAPARAASFRTDDVDEEDLFGEGIELAEDLLFIGQIETRTTFEENFDLDDASADERADYEFSLRARVVWDPTDDLTAVGTVRHRQLYRDDDNKPLETIGKTTLGEAFLQWRDVLGTGLDLQLGRQDFDERREWVYDQNLDAIRLVCSRPKWRLEASVSTTLSGGSDRDEESLNTLLYLSNNDRRRHAAAYVLHREIDAPVDESPTHAGLRALGDWIPDNKSWLDVAILQGEVAGVDVKAWGMDLGTTWTPTFAGPFSFTVGYAFGTGDKNPVGGNDRTFRQTGFQDNTDKWAGVTSFRYYGELVDPELANLQVLTAGVGVELAEKTSLDVVFHHLRQDQAIAMLVDTDLDAVPNGAHPTLGTEVDVILGSRRWKSWDFELVGGWFRPGRAFDEDDDAFLGKLQLRYRF